LNAEWYFPSARGQIRCSDPALNAGTLRSA